MGRELRMVPPNWEHPKDDNGRHIPLIDESYVDAITDWINNHSLWLEGKHPDQLSYRATSEYLYYAEWGGNAPEIERYRPEFTEEPTWYQVYETVSEGTPIAPPFATKEELINYLVENGDFLGHKWNVEQAEHFINESGWCPSLIVTGGKVYSGHEYIPE